MPMSRSMRLAAPILMAVAAASAAQAQTMTGDRYGGAPSGDAAAAAPSPLRGRMLDWPGKGAGPTTESAATRPYPVPQPYVQSRYAVPAPAQRDSYAPAPSSRWTPSSGRGDASGSYVASRYGAPVRPAASSPSERPYQAAHADDGWRPVFAAPATSGERQAPPILAGAPGPTLPTSIYSPSAAGASTASLSPAARAAALPPPMRGSAAQRYGYDPAQDHTVRFYSVHRAFGLQPDPPPIPPQFFTATADLASPPGPLTTERTTTTSSGSTTHAVRATPDAGTD